ncbi:hypothetical protein BH09MYX1_BH09MYX1_13420 [soil metagenome]
MLTCFADEWFCSSIGIPSTDPTARETSCYAEPMTHRLFVVATMVAVLVACGASDDPIVSGFACGAWTQAVCPPASTCVQEECDHSDCATFCRARTRCDPANDACPSGTVCDESTKRCMPRKICTSKEECYPDEQCVAGGYSRSICER